MDMTALNFDIDYNDHETVIEQLARSAFDDPMDSELDEPMAFDTAVELYGGEHVEDAIADMGEDAAAELYTRHLTSLAERS